jgi:phosphatidylserine/phosphatidylglycerophosphate/cardiolipin synthase-like enzyme
MSILPQRLPGYLLTALILCFFAPDRIRAQMSIAEARELPPGSTVTIRGLVTNGQELGNIRYIQDAGAALPAFPGSGSAPGFAAGVQRGDSVEVTGVLLDFNGLLEISPVLSYAVLASGQTLPEPRVLAFGEVSELHESILARFENVRFAEGGFFAANNLYSIVDGKQEELAVFIRTNHPLVGHPIPTGDIDLVAILSDFNGFQLLPRDSADLIPTGPLFFTSLVSQTDLSPFSVTMEWATNLSSSSRIRYTDPAGWVRTDTVSASTIQHVHTVSGLEPATVYEVEVFAERPGLSVPGNRRFMSTASVLPGSMDVYFTKSTDPTFSNGPLPLSTSGDDLLDALIQAIGQAEERIDVCIYNINEAAIVQALEMAYAKGVQVRLIAASATANTALEPAPAFPVIYGNTWGLMHNKFVIFDAELPDRAAVFTGSMNFTSQQIFNHFNNMVWLQDQALARAYTLEFEEMWGSKGPDPDTALARFGSGKKVNTPHLFRIEGALVSLYFSPSDNTNQAILDELARTSQELQFALLTFTKDDLAGMVIHRHQAGCQIRGIIDNVNDNGSDYGLLLAAGVPVKDHKPSTILHHKYAILDQQAVITGSHNWSNAANTINDENTLIIRDPAVANQFIQEFEARWAELPTLNLAESSGQTEGPLRYLVAYPGELWVRTHSLSGDQGRWDVLDMTGRQVLSRSDQLPAGEGWLHVDTPFLPGGVYVLRWISNQYGQAGPLLFSIF